MRWLWLAPLALVALAALLAHPQARAQEAQGDQGRVVLPDDLRAGPHHQVSDPVPTDGFLRSYTLESDYGVFEAQGDLEQAKDAAWRAATLVPDDVYLLWQAARISAALEHQAGG